MHRTYKGTTVACYIGYFVQAIVNNLSPILFIVYRERLGVSLQAVNSLILINFLSQTAVDALSVKIVDRIGYKKIILASHVCAFLGLVLLGTLPLSGCPRFLALAISTVVSALGSGMIEVTISPLVDAIPNDRKEANMSLLHSFYCWGQTAVVALSTLFIHIIGEAYWYLLPLLWALVPLGNIINFSTLPFPKTLREEEKIPLKRLFTSKGFLVAMLLMLCAGASELAMSQWSSYFAETALGVEKYVGDLLGPCLFAVFMGAGRLLYGVFGEKLHLKKAMYGCAALCTACYLTASLSKSSMLTLLACALTGFSISLFWPGTLSLTARLYPNGGAAMFGVLAIMGDIGCTTGPWLIGLATTMRQSAQPNLSDGNALKGSLGISSLFPVLIVVGLLLLPKFQKSKNTVDM